MMSFTAKQICLLAIVLLGIAQPSHALQLVDFEDVALPSSSPTGTGSFFDGHGPNAIEFAASDPNALTSGGITFQTGQFGPGFSVSNVNDTTTITFDNQFAAITGTGFGGSGNYATAFGLAVFNLPENRNVVSLQITNTTTTALILEAGNAFSRPFGGASGNDPDFFSVTFNGFSDLDASGVVTGSQEFVLADFRFDDNSLDFIVDEFQLLDLTALGNARSVQLSFTSTDVGDFGINTPTFIAIDNIQLTATDAAAPKLLGDVNLDGAVDFLDISPFILVLSTGGFQAEADIDQNGAVDFLDISPFISILSR